MTIQLPQIPKATLLAVQTKEILEANLQQLANNLSGSVQECWDGAGYTPQEYIAAYGTNATRVFQFHGQLIGLLKANADILPESAQIPDSVLALVGPYTANDDGTITVQP